MDAIDLISKGETSKAVEALLLQAKSANNSKSTKSLVLLKSNLKRSKREYSLGLITHEEYNVVTAKTNQYLLDFINGEPLEVQSKEVQGKLKNVIKYPLLILSGLTFFYSLLLFYLRQDVLSELIKYQNFDVDISVLITPIVLLVGSVFLFLKTKNHA